MLCCVPFAFPVMALFVTLRVPMVNLCCLLSIGSYSWLKFTIVSFNDEVMLFFFVSTSMSMLGIVLIKYSGNVWL